MRAAGLALLALLGLSACERNAPSADSAGEPRFHLDRDRITVSGISSGAYMAGQFHIAYSEWVNGAALLAGGPYGCAGGSITAALGPCVKGDGLDLEALIQRFEQMATSGGIGDPANLRDDRVWIFHGAADETVARSVSQAARDFYLQLLPEQQVAFVDSVEVVHGMPTEATGRDCDDFGTPFINACGFDAAGILLSHLYGPLEAPTAKLREPVAISQTHRRDAGLAERAWLYLPTACIEGAACGLHIAFHGCAQSEEYVGNAFVKGAGYNEWAETNRIAVLYPQAASSKIAPMNPYGCWDWWGYTGDHYATREGLQLAAVRAMVESLSGSP